MRVSPLMPHRQTRHQFPPSQIMLPNCRPTHRCLCRSMMMVMMTTTTTTAPMLPKMAASTFEPESRTTRITIFQNLQKHFRTWSQNNQNYNISESAQALSNLKPRRLELQYLRTTTRTRTTTTTTTKTTTTMITYEKKQIQRREEEQVKK